jgi:ribose 1,5-bisphosphokinase
MRGVLILIVGPSGVGKDSLIAGARDALRQDPRFAFPARYVTRPADAGGEDHIAISQTEYAKALTDGVFSLAWAAHGHQYALPASIEADLARGLSVVCNVSRSVIDTARERFAPIGTISVHARRELLMERLKRRGRESDEEIAARLKRADACLPGGKDIFPFDNSTDIDLSIVRFTHLLKTLTQN